MKKYLVPSAIFLLLALVLYKSVSVFISEIYFHEYKKSMAKLRDEKRTLEGATLCRQYAILHKANLYSRKNPSVHYEMARLLHRVAGLSRVGTKMEFCHCENTALENCGKKSVLELALKSYENSSKYNCLANNARFWALVIRNNLRYIDNENQESFSAEFLISMNNIVNYIKSNPLIYRHAGGVAAFAKDDDAALDYFQKAMSISLDGMETMANQSRLLDGGVKTFVSIVPDTQEAQQRLHRILVDMWRFDLARVAFNNVRQLSGEPIFEDDPENLVANGEFADPLGSHFMGWQIQKRKGIEVSLDPGIGRLEFVADKGPETFFHFWQKVPVKPGKSYRFEGLIKPEPDGRYASGAYFGFEVIHPYDFELFAAGDDCKVAPSQLGPVCVGKNPDKDGFYRIMFMFEPPQPLRMVKLRFRWGWPGGKGKIVLKKIRITQMPNEPEVADAGTYGGLNNNKNEK